MTTHHASTPRISAVLNTRNAAEHLDEVLTALHGFDEIILVDMHSTDDTRAIATRHGARIIDFEPCGICEPARNAAIQAASNPWVLIVDADEIVPEALRKHLYEVAASPDAPAALRIPRKNFFMNKMMRSTYPDHIIRFVRRDAIDWPPVIHAVPVVDGRIDTIPARRKDLALVHLARNTVESRLEKLERYTAREVERRGPRRYNAFAYLFKPLTRFLHAYLFKGGFRDGHPGLLWALLDAQYKLATIARQDALARNRNLTPPPIS
ncbi:MAG: glycosyltransferase family 2 protein [Muribaculaceae bacterium]|nr:glycosyltransferase family 2 protein [Muribaculaceae bacterium]